MAVLTAAGSSCEKKDMEKVAVEPPVVKKLSTQAMTIAGKEFAVELAYLDATRERGMMYRKEMGDNEGMLFVFPWDQYLSFYMKNCLIDLDILYLKTNGRIEKIMTMLKPVAGKELLYYDSDKPVRYALELPAGMAKQLKLQVGDVIDIPSRVRKIIPE